MKTVLVTGGAGYIGSILTRKLLMKGYYVKVFDCLKWSGDSLLSIINHPKLCFINGDLRDTQKLNDALKNCNSVIHLAAIVGDPACKLEPKLAEEVNWKASVKLFNLSAEHNINHFIFASTCSNYGKMSSCNEYVNEESKLNPISWYAELKVRFEEYMLSREQCSFPVFTILRFSTVYGLSPRMRFDLTVNEFAKEAVLERPLDIYGEQFWRPYCHVDDLANSCILVLKTDINLVRNEIYNVGASTQNYQKRSIAEQIKKIIPTFSVKYIHKEEDPRDYRVDFSKIKQKLNFKITKTPIDGISEIKHVIESKIISDADSQKYKNC